MFSVLKRTLIIGLAGCGLLVLLPGCTCSESGRDTNRLSNGTKATQVQTDQPANRGNESSAPFFAPASLDNTADTMATNILAWDSNWKEYRAKAGEENAKFTFNLTNISPELVVIYATSTRCGCTVAQLPATPWTISPGGDGQIHATVDLRKKGGIATNDVIIFSNKGNKLLKVVTIAPPPQNGQPTNSLNRTSGAASQTNHLSNH
jgi:hypothetical protein